MSQKEEPLVSVAYRVSSAAQADFSEADRKFEAIKQRLTSKQFRDMTHSGVERHLQDVGLELMRELLQVFLTVVGKSPASGAVVGADGTERTHVRRDTTRTVESVFGPVVVTRTSHSARGCAALKPVDAWLNLPPDRYSLEVRRRVSITAAQSSFDATLASLDMTTGAHVPKRQAEELVVKAAQDFDGFYATRCASPLSDQPGPFLILTVDQKGVVMHPEDLRAATLRRSSRYPPSALESRYAPGQNMAESAWERSPRSTPSSRTFARARTSSPASDKRCRANDHVGPSPSESACGPASKPRLPRSSRPHSMRRGIATRITKNNGSC